MYQTRQLILNSITPIKGKDRNTGEDFTSFKHEFLAEDNTVVEGYAPNDGYKKDVSPVLAWDSSKAKPFLFESKTFQGETKWKLVERLKADAVLRDLKK